MSLSFYSNYIYSLNSPNKPNSRNPTSRFKDILYYSHSIILEHFNAILMASMNSCFLISIFFICSFLFYIPLPVTGSFHLYRSRLSSINDTASTNSTKHHHIWVGPIGNRVITVNVNGSADFRSVQAAVDSVPNNNRENVFIQISAGYYM